MFFFTAFYGCDCFAKMLSFCKHFEFVNGGQPSPVRFPAKHAKIEISLFGRKFRKMLKSLRKVFKPACQILKVRCFVITLKKKEGNYCWEVSFALLQQKVVSHIFNQIFKFRSVH